MVVRGCGSRTVGGVVGAGGAVDLQQLAVVAVDLKKKTKGRD